MFKLIYSNQKNLTPEFSPGLFKGSSLIKSNISSRELLCIRQERNLLGYVYDAASEQWLYRWREVIYNGEGNYPISRYPWLVAGKLLPDEDVVILQHPDGIRFYRSDSDKPGLQLFAEDGNFHEVYVDTLLFGHFYPNVDWVGVMSRKSREVNFYLITPDSFTLDKDEYPVFPLNRDLNLTSNWSSKETDFFLTNFIHKEPEKLVLRSTTGLEFYQFNSDYILESVINTTHFAKSGISNWIEDRLFFGSLTDQVYQDIVHLNASGLFVYQYNTSYQDFIPINHNDNFTQAHGWHTDYNKSTRLVDVTGDGFDDLVYTGHKGLEILSFDSVDASWKNVFDSSSIKDSHRYGDVVGTLPASAIRAPVIFTQTFSGDAKWARVVKNQEAIETENGPTLAVPDEFETMTKMTSWEQMLPRENSVIPEQIVRSAFTEKPLLRWSEQWGNNFLQQAVDHSSGNVRFSVPLVDYSVSTNLKVQLAISYNSDDASAAFLGVGWSVSLAQDYIFVDHQGSIYARDAKYYLVLDGNAQLLDLTASEGGIKRFQLAQQSGKQSFVTNSTTIEYNDSQEHWVIDNLGSQAVYGRTPLESNIDFIQWSLAWANWRGPGRDSKTQIPLAVAWYLNAHLDKNNNKTLYYSYEKDKVRVVDGKTYTSALRLKNISDNHKQINLALEYELKTAGEYITPSYLDERGNMAFPVPLTQNHYLRSYHLTTAAYSQTLQFVYQQVGRDERLLTGIVQPLATQLMGQHESRRQEDVLQFQYQRLLGKQVLKSCIASNGLKVDFTYRSITPPPLPIAHQKVIFDENKLVYPVPERPQITYGPDYAIIAYRIYNNVGGKIVLRVLNREMTQVITDCFGDIGLTCPTTQAEIVGFTLVAYPNSFAVFVKSEVNQNLFLFERSEQTWHTTPPSHEFSKGALVQFSDTIIATKEPLAVDFKLFECIDNQPGWNITTLTAPRQITQLVLHKQQVAIYDDHELRLFYRDSQSHWQSRILEYNLAGFATMNRHTLECFDLDTETKKNYLQALDGNGLQMYNNLILLSALKNNSDDQLSSHIQLILLDAQYNIANSTTFEIYREKISQITHGHKAGNSTYHLAYEKEGTLFKLKIKSISGEAIKTINEIRNRNKKEDAMKKLLQDENNNKQMQEFLRRMWLINNPDLYRTQITPHGAYCGNDTLLRLTGTSWQREPILPTVQSVRLGRHFILESDEHNRSLMKLYKQDRHQHKEGNSLRELLLESPGQLINRYPVYLAYQVTANSVKVLTFKDANTIDHLREFPLERLLAEKSDFQNLITTRRTPNNTRFHSEPEECIIRPVSTLVSPKSGTLASQVTLTGINIERTISYEYSFSSDQQNQSYSKTLKIIPGADIRVAGWSEERSIYRVDNRNLTNTKHWFDASGQVVLKKLAEKGSTQNADRPTDDGNASFDTTVKVNPSHLLDKTGQLLISDFTPYNLTDEMTTYYGFESYERNQIGGSHPTHGSYGNITAEKKWRMAKTEIIEKSFAFTGENYLRLDNTETHKGSAAENEPCFIEGDLTPSDQTTTYVASCWLRSSTTLELNSPTSCFKAVLSTTSGQEITGLLAEAKQKSGDWFYLEILLNFMAVKQMYQSYLDHITETNSSLLVALPSVDEVRFKITLRVEPEDAQALDLDHIRFFPLIHDFQANVYNSPNSKAVAIINENGLVSRTLYDELNQEIAAFEDDGHLEELISYSKTGRLMPQPLGAISGNKPSRLSIKPQSGFYETFDSYSLSSKWKIEASNDGQAAWRIAQGQLWHKLKGQHSITANPGLFDSTSAAIRCYFALQSSGASLSFNWNGLSSLSLTRDFNNLTSLQLLHSDSISQLPVVGELILVVEQNQVRIWIDGVLLSDQTVHISEIVTANLWSSFSIDAQDQVLVQDLLVMNNPSTQVEYYNELEELIQTIELEDTKAAIITEIVYDRMGRKAITTKPTRIYDNMSQPLLAYRSNFVSNIDPNNPLSVWTTGLLRGEVDRLNTDDNGYCYTRIEYAKNPLNEEQIHGLVGRNFSITGPFAKHFSHDSKINFLDLTFPSKQGYRQKEERLPNGSQKVSISDKHDNHVALYVRVSGFNHLLSVYEYDAENRLIKILPPLYHEKVGTATRLSPWQPGDQHLPTEDKHWQQTLATRYIYDSKGQLIRKVTPDSGTVEYLYNSAGQRRFMFSISNNNQTDQVTYFNYDSNNQLSSTGYITQSFSTNTLQGLVENLTLPHARLYQQFDYADDNPNPLLRGCVKRFITYNELHNETNEVNTLDVIEELRFNPQQQVIEKISVSVLGQADTEPFSEIKWQYVNNKVNVLMYPININGKRLSLMHHYNKLGQLTELGMANQTDYYARFIYNADGQLASEQYLPKTPYNFTRHYDYLSPGFLKQVSDPFLTEEISYTEKGYGQAGNGDGIIMRTAFNASWPEQADGRWFQVTPESINNKYSALCIKALKTAGYLSSAGVPVKEYIKDAETTLPLLCRGKTEEQLAKLVAQKQMPRYYGHRYAYGNHQELIKAKYFTEETESIISPLQPNSFSKTITTITTDQSKEIWDLLVGAGYVLSDSQSTDQTIVIGKSGKSFFRGKDLLADLAKIDNNYLLYAIPIQQLIITTLSAKQIMSLEDFKKSFLSWESNSIVSPSILLIKRHEETASKMYLMLRDKGYIPGSSDSMPRTLDKNFVAILSKFFSILPEIIHVLTHHFTHGLGRTAFDLESYDIDANGNHRLFYTGFDRYNLTYNHENNQIQSVTKFSEDIDLTSFEFEQNYAMHHDVFGNVITALHKKIQTIEYHPVSQRTTRIKLTDGRVLRLYYDAQGERILKQVLNTNGEVSHETYYVRDNRGRVLLDQNITYLSPPLPPQKLVTAYLYGPRGLLGFIRNDNFYSVTTDHAGSIRLIIKDGHVVAAYDYLPYGQLMRSYGNDPRAHIAYRYTGQEWDEETGLYNYHARLYDPSIGRFYQPDPQTQYFSPYKYAGNSPISLIDPDGEFAFFLIPLMIAGFAVGAYLGGATANNRWNPKDWDISDQGTWLGIVGGGIGGALLPIGGAASLSTFGVIGTIGLSVAGAYLTTAAANGEWNFVKWEWDRPHTWSAIFQGVGSGVGIGGGVGAVHAFAAKFASGIGKTLFLTVSYSAAGAVAYSAGVVANNGNAAFWQWDWANPGTWSALVDGFDGGLGWPQGIAEIARGITKLASNSKKLGSLFSKNLLKTPKLKSILKNTTHPLFKVAGSVVMAYFMGSSANGELDITRWNLSVFSTYEGVLNGVFFGKDTAAMLKLARGSKSKQPSTELVVAAKNKWSIKNSSKTVSILIDSMQAIFKEKSFKRIMEQSFSDNNLWFSKLKQVETNPTLKRDVENFFKRGLESWKTGKNIVPEELQQLLRKQADQNIKSSSNKLTELQKHDSELSKKQQEIFPDRDLDFISCRRTNKRRKRAAYAKSIISCILDFINPIAIEFKNDPKNFLTKNAISTLRTGGGATSLSGNGPHKFVLNENAPGQYALSNVPDTSTSTNVVDGYWLPTSRGDPVSLQDPMNGKIRIDPEGDVRYVFTAELQGCSIYIKYDQINKKIEIFHYNRPELASIYRNVFNRDPSASIPQLSPIGNARDLYVNGNNQNIKELPPGKFLLNKDGNILHASDGVITINQDIFYRDEGQLKKLENIFGKPIQDTIETNKKILQQQKELAAAYPVVIRWEDYLGLPANYPLLQAQYILPRTAVTPVIYRDGNGRWQFVSQQITHNADSTRFELHQNHNGYKVDLTEQLGLIDHLQSAGNSNGRIKRSLNNVPHRDGLTVANNGVLTKSVLFNITSYSNEAPFTKHILNRSIYESNDHYKIELENISVVKTAEEWHQYIRKKHFRSLMPSKDDFVSHLNRILSAFVLIGYYGTNEREALSIILNGFLECKVSESKEPKRYNVYVTENIENALVHATDSPRDSSYTKILAVYAKKRDIRHIYTKNRDINDGAFNSRKGLIIRRNPGEASLDGYEIIVTTGIELKPLVLPLITSRDFEAVKGIIEIQRYLNKSFNYFEIERTFNNKSLKDLKDHPGLEFGSLSSKDFKYVKDHLSQLKLDAMAGEEFYALMKDYAIPLENTLDHAIEKIGHGVIIHDDDGKQKRSVASEEENDIINDLNIQGMPSFEINSMKQTDTYADETTSSASKSYTHFWPITIAKTVFTAISYYFPKNYSNLDYHNTDLDKEKDHELPSILERLQVNSNTVNGQKRSHNNHLLKDNEQNASEQTNYLFHPENVYGTLLLLDLCIRKKNGNKKSQSQKYYRTFERTPENSRLNAVRDAIKKPCKWLENESYYDNIEEEDQLSQHYDTLDTNPYRWYDNQSNYDNYESN